jgi:hypothetical protein
MDRRQFTKSVTGLAAALALLSPDVFAQNAATTSSANVPVDLYKSWVRFRCRGGICRLRIRVNWLGNVTQTIPYLMELSKSLDMSNPVVSEQYFADPRTSFAQQTNIAIEKHQPYFLRLSIVGNPSMKTKVWAINTGKKRVSAALG